MNEDYHDILAALVAQDARFLVVGAHALAVHGYPRSTVDIGVWIDCTPENARRVWQALAEFGAPLADLRIDQRDLERPDVVVQIGLPPNRVDLLTGISGLAFADNSRTPRPRSLRFDAQPQVIRTLVVAAR